MINTIQKIEQNKGTIVATSTLLGATIYGGIETLLMILVDGIEEYLKKDGPGISLEGVCIGGLIGFFISAYCVPNTQNNEGVISYTALESDSPLAGETNIEMAEI